MSESSTSNGEDRDDDVVAYSFTVTPVKKTGEEINLAQPFDRVQFEHPSETYGDDLRYEVSNVTKLTEKTTNE